MTNFIDRERALALRKQEMSYSQIKEILGISKSTLSGWLKNYPLSRERINELRGRNEQRIERFRKTMQKKREMRLNEIYRTQKLKLLPLSKRELLLTGLFLYWGEGTKNQTSVSISNNDPTVIKFFIAWLVKSFGIPKNHLQIQLHLYGDMNIKKEISYWSDAINIPISQFSNPYIKKTSKERINHKGGFEHGTCNAGLGNARLAEKILMGIKVFGDKYGNLRT